MTDKVNAKRIKLLISLAEINELIEETLQLPTDSISAEAIATVTAHLYKAKQSIEEAIIALKQGGLSQKNAPNL